MFSNQTLDILIGVDDTGGEGQNIESRSVDKNRQTLVAAIIGKEDIVAFDSEWRVLVAELTTAFGVSEFHSSQLWGGGVLNSRGTKKAKKEAEVLILDAFAKATQLCLHHGVGFVVQTVHEETFNLFLKSLREMYKPTFHPLADELVKRAENRKLAALLMLSRQVLHWGETMGKAAGANENNVGINVEWQIDGCIEFTELSEAAINFIKTGFKSGDVKFLQSHESSLIQAADFAAYILNRHMYFVANRKEADAAKEELSVGFLRAKNLLFRTQGIVPLILNIPSIRLALADVHAKTYDELQDQHRASSGLNPLNYKHF